MCLFPEMELVALERNHHYIACITVHNPDCYHLDSACSKDRKPELGEIRAKYIPGSGFDSSAGPVSRHNGARRNQTYCSRLFSSLSHHDCGNTRCQRTRS